MIDYIPDPTATKTPVERRISLDSVLPIPRPAFLFLVSLASLAGTRHRFALLRQPIPKLKRCAGQTVHLGILRGKENVEARARMSSTSEEISLIPTLLTYSPIPLSHDDRGTVSLLGCQSLVIIANTSN